MIDLILNQSFFSLILLRFKSLILVWAVGLKNFRMYVSYWNLFFFKFLKHSCNPNAINLKKQFLIASS
jgi:hypothetical protein